MPKVSERHLETRRQQILLAALRCFAREGFHKTTMRAICREARLSPGAVYRYFRGKEDLIRAVAEEGMRANAARMVPVESARSAAEALALSLDRFLSCLGVEEAATSIRTDVRLTAEALEEGAVRDVVLGGYANLIGLFEAVVRGGETDHSLPEDLAARSVARVVVALFQGLETQKALDPDIDLEGCARAAAALLRGRLAVTESTASSPTLP